MDVEQAPEPGPRQPKQAGPIEVEGEGPLVVREKLHQANPMGLDQALYEMELVGHDFYLFHNKESGRPCVVYRRHAYDYGLIRLTDVPQNGTGPAHAVTPAAQEAAASV